MSDSDRITYEDVKKAVRAFEAAVKASVPNAHYEFVLYGGKKSARVQWVLRERGEWGTDFYLGYTKREAAKSLADMTKALKFVYDANR